VTSGFPVLSAGAPETDGPPGARALGDALAAGGAEVVYLADPLTAPLFEALDARPLEVVDWPASRPLAERARAARAWLEAADPTHLVAVERPGRAADGRYRNMRGEEITALTATIDEAFLVAREVGVHTVGVGDGGNEVGLGRLRDLVAAAVPHGERIATVVATDEVVVAGVSTWGAWGVVAGLSLLAGRDLLPTSTAAAAAVERLVAAGAVDGVTHRPEPTVDGLPEARSLEVLEALRTCLG